MDGFSWLSGIQMHAKNYPHVLWTADMRIYKKPSHRGASNLSRASTNRVDYKQDGKNGVDAEYG